jgi:hypothetical protein
MSVESQKSNLKKIVEIQNAIKALPSEYFDYSEEHKKHILKVKVNSRYGSADIKDLSIEARNQVLEAGRAIERILKSLPSERNIRYLLVIEGQASKDDSPINDELSYRRAIALRNFWFGDNPDLNTVLPNCEVIIAGSGQYGVPREQPDIPPNNQRFMITIIPKIGNIK